MPNDVYTHTNIIYIYIYIYYTEKKFLYNMGIYIFDSMLCSINDKLEHVSLYYIALSRVSVKKECLFSNNEK